MFKGNKRQLKTVNDNSKRQLVCGQTLFKGQNFMLNGYCLLNPSIEEEGVTCKLKRLVQSPNSYLMGVKCPGCYKITTFFSHAQTVVLCAGCSTVLCQPTGGKTY
jgi:small subunit ribosomal protein S27e